MPSLWVGLFSLFLSLPCDVPTDSARGGSNGITFSISIIYTLIKGIVQDFTKFRIYLMVPIRDIFLNLRSIKWNGLLLLHARGYCKCASFNYTFISFRRNGYLAGRHVHSGAAASSGLPGQASGWGRCHFDIGPGTTLTPQPSGGAMLDTSKADRTKALHSPTRLQSQG
jgi:hypothetical protein